MLNWLIINTFILFIDNSNRLLVDKYVKQLKLAGIMKNHFFMQNWVDKR